MVALPSTIPSLIRFSVSPDRCICSKADSRDDLASIETMQEGQVTEGVGKKKTTHQRSFRRQDRQSALSFTAIPTPREWPQLVLPVSKVTSLAEPAAARLPPVDSVWFSRGVFCLVRRKLMSQRWALESTTVFFRSASAVPARFRSFVPPLWRARALRQRSSYLKQMRVFAFSALPRKRRGGGPPLLRR